MGLNFASICSGIGVAESAWMQPGWNPVFFSEIEPFPSAVLLYHYPNVPNLGDMTTINGDEWRGKVDLLAGGTPCQAFSIAGNRKSLADERGNLTLKFVELCDAISPAFIVWENVPGVLSTPDNAFGCFLGALAGEDGPLVAPGGKWTNAGYVLGPKRAIAWRVLDAQYFGVAQRRRRVFLIACPRGGADPREILFESDGVRRDTPPNREAGKAVAALTATGVGTCGADDNQGQAGNLIPAWPAEVAPTLNAAFGSKMGLEDQHALGGAGLFVPCSQFGEIAGTLTARHDSSPCADRGMTVVAIHPHCVGRAPNAGPQGKEYLDDGSAYTMDSRGVAQAVAFQQNQLGEVRTGDVAGTLATNSNPSGRNTPMVAIGLDEEQNAIVDGFGCLKSRERGGGFEGSVMQPDMQVRRLTPRECERLQGLPDDYTLIPYRGKSAEQCPDGPRYKALGNAWNRAVAVWLGKRIDSYTKSNSKS